MNSAATWELLEERRVYRADTAEAVADAASAGLTDALEHGYVVERVAWSDDSLTVTVEYTYDPARAGRPL